MSKINLLELSRTMHIFGSDLLFYLLTGKPKRYLFDILADEEYKRRFKLKQREIVEENYSE